MSGHDRRPKEAAQLGAYHSMLTGRTGYYMDSRGRRKTIDGELRMGIVTFCPDGTWAMHEVDTDEANAAYELALAMRHQSKVSTLYAGKAIVSEPFDPNPTLTEALGHVPEGCPEWKALANAWVAAGLGAPSQGQVPPERYGEAMALIFKHASRFQPFPYVEEPALCAKQDVADSLLIRLRNLPLDIRQQVLGYGTGLGSLDASTLLVEDAEDWDRHITAGEKKAGLRLAEAEDLRWLIVDIETGEGEAALRSIVRGLPDDVRHWTERDLTIAAACWKALDEDHLGLFGDELCVNVARADALVKTTEGGKRALTKIAKTKAQELGLTRPSKWDDLMADPVLYAAVVAA